MRRKIKKDKTVTYQLSIAEPDEVEFDEGGATRLIPARWAPQVENFEPVSLDGEWLATCWPFAEPEDRLVSEEPGRASWHTVVQPGKVQYIDPEVWPEGEEEYNRVYLDHIDDSVDLLA